MKKKIYILDTSCLSSIHISGDLAFFSSKKKAMAFLRKVSENEEEVRNLEKLLSSKEIDEFALKESEPVQFEYEVGQVSARNKEPHLIIFSIVPTNTEQDNQQVSECGDILTGSVLARNIDDAKSKINIVIEEKMRSGEIWHDRHKKSSEPSFYAPDRYECENCGLYCTW